MVFVLCPKFKKYKPLVIALTCKEAETLLEILNDWYNEREGDIADFDYWKRHAALYEELKSILEDYLKECKEKCEEKDKEES